jgi:uncharacterized phage protein gp47/JayE
MSLADLTNPLTRQDVEASIYATLDGLDVHHSAWKPASPVRTVIVGVSIVLAALSTLQAKIARSGFLELSEGEWLTQFARTVYRVERQGATFAAGEVTLTNSSGGIYLLDADDLIVVNTATGQTYRNTAAVTIGAFALAVTVPIRATEAGTAGGAAADAIDTLSTTLTGVTCTNPVALVGRDAEKDRALRARCSEKLGSLSPFGPADSYAFAARAAVRADGSGVGITRIKITKDGYGNVGVIVATDTGETSAPDLAIVDLAVQRWAVPEAVTASVSSASPVVIDIAYEAWMHTSGVGTPNVAKVRDLIAASLRDLVLAEPIGGHRIDGGSGKLFAEAVRAVIGSTLPEIFHVELTSPASDIVLTSTQVAVLGTITAEFIHQLPPPDAFGA